MAVITLEVGPIACSCHIVHRDRDAGTEEIPCVVIDPGEEAGRITAAVKKAGLRVEAVFLTHSHADHIGGVDEILAAWPGSVMMCSAETSRRAGDPRLNLSVFIGAPIIAQPAGRLIADGEEFTAAGMDWKAVEIPGHDPGELVFIRGDGMEVFSGDTLFAGSIGRSDFPGGNGPALVLGVKKLLAALPPDATIYPGHGTPTQARIELAHNPFLR